MVLHRARRRQVKDEACKMINSIYNINGTRKKSEQHHYLEKTKTSFFP
jgi:hypothetical protein